MPDTPSYIFHAHAAVLGGRIIRIGEGPRGTFVKDGFIDLPGASLTVVGGRSTANVTGDELSRRVRTAVRFESGTAFAAGEFDDARAYFDSTLMPNAPRPPATTTKVSAAVQGVDVGLLARGNVRILADGIRGGFTARSERPGDELSIQLDRNTGFDGNLVTFIDAKGNRYELRVAVERDIFRKYDTYSAIEQVAGSRTFVRDYAHVLHRAGRTTGRAAVARVARTPDGGVLGTIVRPLKWNGPAFPGSRIDPNRPNSVYVPGLGFVFFGEIIIEPQSRRLTMLRIRLGSPFGGDFAAADVMDNTGGSF
jgi:hypothetical protein